MKKRIVGYADQISVAPGETIEFKVTADGIERYRADIARLISCDHHPGGSGTREEVIESPVSGAYDGRWQETYAGSYAVIDDAAPFDALESFTLQAMIWPTMPDRGRQVILGKWSEADETGYALVIDNGGALALMIGDGPGSARVVSTGLALSERIWCFAGASFDAASGMVQVYQEAMIEYALSKGAAEVEEVVAPGPPGKTTAPLMIAASCGGEARGGVIGARHYDGKIDSPRVADRALGLDEMSGLMRQPVPDELQPAMVAAWDLARGVRSTRIEDASANSLHGRLVNLPARAMKGYNWTGAEMNWRHAPEQYGAIHFHHDDLYDAGWETDFSLTVPDGLASGVYCARLEAGGEVDRIPFVVRPPRDKATNDVAFLVPTASYMAYANEHGGVDSEMNEVLMGHLSGLKPEDLMLNEHREWGYSLYEVHADGSGVCYSSRLRPVLNWRPGYTIPWVGAAGTAAWQWPADIHIVAWLDAMGHGCDFITDEDLHAEGLGLLERYRCVLTGSHPEYYSTRMWDALDGYLGQGGRLMYLGGNGFYWRIAYHDALPGVLELRRAEDGIRDWVAEPGEYYHSFSGEYGGLWRRLGRPPQGLVGVGMATQGFDISGYFRRTPGSNDPRAAFVFEGVTGEIIGDFGTVGGGAAGLELDRCDHSLGSPPHTLVLATSENLTHLYFLCPEEVNSVGPIDSARETNLARGDITFVETEDGGAVFSASSISWAGSLSWNGFDNNVSKITDNVLRRFLDPAPF